MRHFAVHISMGFMLAHFNVILRSKFRYSKFICLLGNQNNFSIHLLC